MELNAASLITSENTVSFGQEALWLQHKMHPESGCYNTIFAWEVPSDLHIVTFKVALKILANRHAILRTTYAINDHGELRSKTQANYSFRFEERATGNSTDDEIYSFIHKELHTPFDLATEIPKRWALFRRTTNLMF